GCQGYLARIRDTLTENGDAKNVPIICKFPNVFPKELLGLPPNRDIEFYIDTVPGTIPISMPPYRMVLAELRELKEQLQDLLDKGFIQSSTSSQDAPVLFVKKKRWDVLSVH